MGVDPGVKVVCFLQTCLKDFFKVWSKRVACRLALIVCDPHTHVPLFPRRDIEDVVRRYLGPVRHRVDGTLFLVDNVPEGREEIISVYTVRVVIFTDGKHLSCIQYSCLNQIGSWSWFHFLSTVVVAVPIRGQVPRRSD